MNRLTRAYQQIGLRDLTNTYTFDPIGNMLTMNRTDGITQQNKTFNYPQNNNKLTGYTLDYVGLSNPPNMTNIYTYDANGNLTKDASKGLNAVKYDRANLPYYQSTANGLFDYLFDEKDQRIYKAGAALNEPDFTREWYVRDAFGREVGLKNMDNSLWTLSMYTNERIASLIYEEPLTSGPDGGDVVGGGGNGGSILDGILGTFITALSINTTQNMISGSTSTESTDPNLNTVIVPAAAGATVGTIALLTGTNGTGEPPRDLLGGLRYYNFDHLGNTRVAYTIEDISTTNTFKLGYKIIGAYDYHPYGKIIRKFNAGQPNGLPGVDERYLTTGHERDWETGLDYRGARFYDSEVGRFLSLDPMAMEFPAWSQYNYVVGNPIFFVDRDGRAPGGPPRLVDNTIGKTNAMVKGFVAAVVDNGFWGFSNAREVTAMGIRQENAGAFNKGQDMGDAASAVIGIVLTDAGYGGTVGGIAAAGPTGGGSLIVSAAGVGALIWGPGITLSANHALATQKGRIPTLNMNSSNESSRREPSPGDKDLPSERAARREAFRNNKVPTSKSNNFKREPVYGKNDNLKGPNGEPSEIIRTKDVNGNDVSIDHHKNGHQFNDNNTFENPHYHGTQGQHYNY